MLNKKTNEWNYSGRKKHLLTGIAFCKCGGRITYNLGKGKATRCICSNYKKYGKKYCTNVHISEEELLKKVAKSLKNNIENNLDIRKLNYSKTNKSVEEYKEEMAHLSLKLEEITKVIGALYEDKTSGIISKDTFDVLIKKYEEQKEKCKEKLEKLKERQDDITNMEQEKTKEKIIENIRFNEINEYNISLVFKLIDKIIIDDREVEIKYKFVS